MANKISLRALQDQDIKYFARWWRDQELAKFTSGSKEKLTNQKLQEYFQNMRSDPQQTHFMINLGRKCIGHIFLSRKPEDWQELHIIIGETELWGQGYGTAAIKLLIKQAAEKGLTNLFLEVRPDNVRAIKCYENCGFKPVRLINYPKNPDQPVTLRMELE